MKRKTPEEEMRLSAVVLISNYTKTGTTHYLLLEAVAGKKTCISENFILPLNSNALCNLNGAVAETITNH